MSEYKRIIDMSVADQRVDPDEVMTGLSAAPVEFTATFKDANDGIRRLFAAFGEPTQDVTIVPEGVRLFGVDWWALRYRFTAKMEMAEDFSAQFTATDPITIERAEWWRRAVFHVVKYPVRWWGMLEAPK